MTKKVCKVVFSFLLLLASFYYTNIAVDIIRSTNPIMKTIQKEKEQYKEEAQDALIEDDTIIPGTFGREVSVDKSFQKMFQYGAYNDSLYTFEEVSPTISIDQYYDKYIMSGREDELKVGLVFKVNRDDNILDLLTILSDNNVTATFFVDGLFIENHRSFVQNMLEKGYEVEVLSYNGGYQELYFKNAVSILDQIRGEKGSFCFSDYKRDKILNLCEKLELHTVVPNIQVKSSPFQTIKKQLKGGGIILMNRSTEELEISIQYIKQRGYSLVRLDDLLSES